ncbi:RecX family transcriptional regulator [Paenibacillus sp. YYML68]|uniref:RecX family transcriptional regulator n=1 Tax=Paenibacillus sp. YYML68 TaxID=2909250 RepID=UPI00249330A7|nr:RecX family transcriptional regulator [Paenibacillus sp. YYML68]
MDEGEKRTSGGTITLIERQPRTRHRYNIHLDGVYAFSVHEDLMIRYRLLKGAVVESEELERLLVDEERHKAYLSAVRLLSSRLRSEHELRARLMEKEFESSIIDHCLDRLRSEGYLNDALFAEQLAKQRSESQRKGRHWIKQELKQKGVPKEHIEAALEQVDEQTEVEGAYKLVSRRYANEWQEDSVKARRKATGFLMRRGYSMNVALKVMDRLAEQWGKSSGEWVESMDVDDVMHDD